tara:strand:- start:89 stop:232 length:144 start_codon:yes stop_codon:yes gene_type:complete
LQYKHKFDLKNEKYEALKAKIKVVRKQVETKKQVKEAMMTNNEIQWQ